MKREFILVGALLMVFVLAACDYSDYTTLQDDNTEKSVVETIPKESTPCFTDLKVGQTITFGYYEQDNIVDNSAELILWEDRTLEPIEWVVLAIEDDKALIISKYALDCFQFHDHPGYAVTWETCYARKWLNEVFYERAFGCYDHDIIVSTTVIPDENPEDTKQGNITQDKVFLLSVSEAEKYYSSNNDRKCRGTEYCYWKNAVGQVSKNENENWCVWWLRPSYETTLIPYVTGYDGLIDKYGKCNDCLVYAIRPAIWIQLNY